MSVAVTGIVTTNWPFNENTTVGTLTTQGINAPVPINQTTNYNTSGTATGQVNLIYGQQITFVVSTPQTFNLQTWLDVFGNAVPLARVREFIVQVVSVTPGWDIKLYSAASNGVIFLPPIANFLTIRAGGMIAIRDPISTGGGNGNVVGGSTLSFTIDPGTHAVVVNILAAGGSAA